MFYNIIWGQSMPQGHKANRLHLCDAPGHLREPWTVDEPPQRGRHSPAQDSSASHDKNRDEIQENKLRVNNETIEQSYLELDVSWLDKHNIPFLCRIFKDKTCLTNWSHQWLNFIVRILCQVVKVTRNGCSFYFSLLTILYFIVK